MPAYDVTVRGKSYHVEILDPDAVPLKVIVDGQTFEVEVANTGRSISSAAPDVATDAQPSGQRRLPVARPSPPPSGDGEAVTAPMPGTILSVEVAPGQSVESGQVVCVLEAMKMKNALRAARAGTVLQIMVQVGQSVAYGDLLVRLG